MQATVIQATNFGCRSRAARHQRSAKHGDGQHYAKAFHSILLFDALFCLWAAPEPFESPSPLNAFVCFRNKARAKRQPLENVP
jgi:hypothetical protein